MLLTAVVVLDTRELKITPVSGWCFVLSRGSHSRKDCRTIRDWDQDF